MTTFVDTNVLIAILKSSEPHHQWSTQQLQLCKQAGPALVCDIVYCEFSVGMPSQQLVDAAISSLALQRFGRTTDPMLIRAGQAFKRYRQQGGSKGNVLPDFLIGAAAEMAGVPLLTANRKDYVGYFPGLKLISPP